MLLIATADLALAKELNQKTSGPRLVALNMERLEVLARREQPKVILLDVRLGGNTSRAVEVIPALRGSAPCSEVVALSPLPSTAEIEELNRLGAYGVADTRHPRFWPTLLELISLASRRASRSIAEARERRASRGQRRRQVH